MKNLIYLLFIFGLLASCQGQAQDKLINNEGKYWHLNRVMKVSPDNDTSVTLDRQIKNVLFQANYEYQFLEFLADDIVNTHIISSHPGISEVQEGRWFFNEEQQSMQYFRIAQYYDPQKPGKDWQVSFPNEKTFILSIKDEKGNAYLNEYKLKKKEIPGTEKFTAAAKEASLGAKEQGLSAEVIGSSNYETRRLELLQQHPDSMNLPYMSATAAIGIMVEYTIDGETISLYADKDGSSEVYYSSGIKHSGGKNLGVLKDLAKKLASNSGRLWESMSPLKSSDKPAEGDIRFFVIHSQNVGEVYISQSRARTGHSDFQLLLHLSESLVSKYNTALSSL